MLNGINSCLGVTSALLVNQPDLTRYTKRPKDAGWRQASSIFASKTLIFFFGIGATAAVQGKFGQAYWNQWDLLNAILDRFWEPSARAGCFFAAVGFGLSVLGVNIGCNAIPFGMFKQSRKVRCQILTLNGRCGCHGSSAEILHNCSRPNILWNYLPSNRPMETAQLVELCCTLCRRADHLLANGSGFLTFLGSYNCFIAPICAVCLLIRG
jgi:NCS1 family nucleobase:cation symporter-1